MVILDAHCDTLIRVIDSEKTLCSNDCDLDIERMHKRGNYVQFFAAFIHPNYYRGNAMKRAIDLIDKFYRDCEECKGKVTVCCNHKDVLETINSKKVAAILAIEGGEALQGSLAALRAFYKLGVRSICLTWNHRNEIADGVGETISEGGLTNFGREVVEEMNKLGMLIDLSHISEKGFWDVMALTKEPVILSHSNSKTICNHRRNITDKQILALKNNGGVMGITLYPSFINEEGIIKISDIIKHIEHIISLVGENHVGIGTDYDQTKPILDEGLDGIEFIDSILEELLKLNYPYSTVEKIASGNFLRVIKDVM
jgi:membrane dipeptidase